MEPRPDVPGYDVLERWGAGSAATVWRGRRHADGLDVALKVVWLAREEVGSVLAEAALLARVRHRHVVHLYDLIPLPGPDGRPAGVALALQPATGGSLAQVLSARDHLTPGELVTVLAPLAGALADLHAAGAVHGDLSPGNVLFLADGMPMLADLGLTRVVGGPGPATHASDGMVAPELLEGLSPSPASDVYAVGALAWLCLVGREPGWVGTREPLDAVAPQLPEGLRQVVTACLAPEPEDRPDAGDVERELLGCADPEPVALSPGADAAHRLTHRLRELHRRDQSSSPEPLTRPWWAPDRRRALWGLGAVAVLLVAVLLGPPAVQRASAWFAGAGSAKGLQTVGPGVPSAASPTPARPAPSTTAPGVGTAPPAGTPPPAGPAQSGPAPSGPAQSSPVPTAEPGASPPPPEPAPQVRVLQDLVDGRAEAWAAADESLLAGSLGEGSPARQADAAALVEAGRLGVSYPGLAFGVERAEVVEGGLEGERVVLDAQVRMSSHQVRGPGPPVDVAGEVHDVRVELRATESGWRIWSWADPP